MIPISKPSIGPTEKQAVLDVLDSGMLAQGPKVAELEARFAEICGTKHAIATSSGTTALHVALLAHGIGPDDEVITTPFTFIASVNSIIYVGARPVLVDILPCCFNLDPAQIEQAITPRTKAIVPVHLYGFPCRMEAIMEIADRYGLVVIEDAAQAVGATYQGKATGSFGTGCFSLYATKNVMSAEGGIITTDDDAVADRSRALRAHGMQRRYYHDMLGFNFRMTDIHAAIGVAQLQRLEEFTTARRRHAAYLNTHIRNPKVVTPSSSCTLDQTCGQDACHVWHQYTVRIRAANAVGDPGIRDRAVEQLAAAGVGSGIFYPVPAHRQRHIRELGLGEVTLPHAEQAAAEVLSLPVHPELSQADLDQIVEAVNTL